MIAILMILTCWCSKDTVQRGCAKVVVIGDGGIMRFKAEFVFLMFMG